MEKNRIFELPFRKFAHFPRVRYLSLLGFVTFSLVSPLFLGIAVFLFFVSANEE